jgi:hypothetical protein
MELLKRCLGHTSKYKSISDLATSAKSKRHEELSKDLWGKTSSAIGEGRCDPQKVSTVMRFLPLHVFDPCCNSHVSRSIRSNAEMSGTTVKKHPLLRLMVRTETGHKYTSIHVDGTLQSKQDIPAAKNSAGSVSMLNLLIDNRR